MGLLRSALIRAVLNYRRSSVGRRTHGHCRFTPSCSTYALELLESRALPIALAAIAWRILRCNPLVARGTHDPAPKPPVRRRPNAVRTASFALLLGGLTVLLSTGLAFGQGISGGCKGTANGRPPATLTQNNPLTVGKGEVVRIAGTAPARASGQTYLDYNISFISGIFETDSRQELHGVGRRWSGRVNVDDYLGYGSGLYEVTGVVTTTTSSYRCPVTFYVYLDGNKAIGIAGAAIAGVGALGTVAAGRGKPPRVDPTPAAGEGADGDVTVDSLGKDLSRDVDKLAGVKKDAGANAINSIASWGCLLAFFIALFQEAEFLLGAMIPITALRSEGTERRVWSKGKPVLGTISGLVMGLGITVAAHQFGLWPLTIMTACVFPLLCAVVGGLRGWRGTAYKVG